jgi:LacI family transcriptional regulator
LKRGQRVTSKDVAELAGVSRTTVSFVLNEVQDVHISQETRQRVLEAARQLNYYPNAAARSLASRQAGAIGLILCQSPEHIIADPFQNTSLPTRSCLDSSSGWEKRSVKTGFTS